MCLPGTFEVVGVVVSFSLFADSGDIAKSRESFVKTSRGTDSARHSDCARTFILARELESGPEWLRLEGHTGRVLSVYFSSDEFYVVTGSADLRC